MDMKGHFEQFDNRGLFVSINREYEFKQIPWQLYEECKDLEYKEIIPAEESGGLMRCFLVWLNPGSKATYRNSDRLMIHEVMSGKATCIVDNNLFTYRPGVIACIPEGAECELQTDSEGIAMFVKILL